MLLSGKIALVTGATRGIGFAISRRFAEEGATVVLSGRSLDKLDAAAAEISASHPGATVVPFGCDVTRHDDVKELFQSVKRLVGQE